MLQQCMIKAPKSALGLNLSRAPWDPYPWVSGVQAQSNAQLGGIRLGDTLLQLNGVDVLGMRISELATKLRDHWQTGADQVIMLMWRQQPTSLVSIDDPIKAAHLVPHGINQQSVQKFATCLQHIAQLLECPVCCDVIKPPGWQCCNGHLLCNNCRNRSLKCPICRVPLGPRGRCLLSDKLFTLLAEHFPCDGVKTSQRESTDFKENCKPSKCTNEYHNEPKMGLLISNSFKRSKKICKQLQVREEGNGIVAVNEDRAECVKDALGIPQVQKSPNDTGLQNCAIKVHHKQNGFEQMLHDRNNMLIKPNLKLSKKSLQMTCRDQAEWRGDDAANINNNQ